MAPNARARERTVSFCGPHALRPRTLDRIRSWCAVRRSGRLPRQQRGEVGRARAGRLVAPDWGFGEDAEAELVAEDVGISGGAASAEEAAVHIIEDEAAVHTFEDGE